MAAPAQAPGVRKVATPVVEFPGPGLARAAGAERTGHVPTASYRIQFGPGFGFSAARKLVPFLRRLGVSHVYSSPIFAARRGSTHGYDVTDPLRLNPELGAAEEFDAFVNDLKRHGMGLILDIVPNHMAASAENPWWEDVLEEGRTSLFAGYFDIGWRQRRPGSTTASCFRCLGRPTGAFSRMVNCNLRSTNADFSFATGSTVFRSTWTPTEPSLRTAFWPGSIRSAPDILGRLHFGAS